jgi:hypothetical protein
VIEKAELDFFTNLVQQRNRTQELLLDLLKIAVHEDEGVKIIPEFNSIFQLVVGVTFSLWRAIVLAQTPIEPLSALEHAEVLLKRLVAFNTIAFSDEKDTKCWMCGFYIANIQYRMWHLHNEFQANLENEELANFVETWSPLTFTPEEASLPTFDEHGPFKTKLFFEQATACLKSLIARLEFLATN